MVYLWFKLTQQVEHWDLNKVELCTQSCFRLDFWYSGVFQIMHINKMFITEIKITVFC